MVRTPYMGKRRPALLATPVVRQPICQMGRRAKTDIALVAIALARLHAVISVTKQMAGPA